MRVTLDHLAIRRPARNDPARAVSTNVEVDPDLADTASVFLEAKERHTTGRSTRNGGQPDEVGDHCARVLRRRPMPSPQIRVQEAELITAGSSRGRVDVEPEGVLVVTQDGRDRRPCAFSRRTWWSFPSVPAWFL